MARNVTWMVFSRVIGLVVYLLLVWFANILTDYIPNDTFIEIVKFLNNTIWIVIVIAVFTFLSEIFGLLVFPFNLPTPLFNGLASIFILTFIFKIFGLFDSLFRTGIMVFLSRFVGIIYTAVFVVVLIIGFITIFTHEQVKQHKSYRRNRE